MYKGQFTPDEARRFHRGEDVTVEGATFDRLKCELADGVYDAANFYTEEQRGALRLLVEKYAADVRTPEQHTIWYQYMEGRKFVAARYVHLSKPKSCHDSVCGDMAEDFDFWLRLLVYQPFAFATVNYRKVILGGRTRMRPNRPMPEHLKQGPEARVAYS